MDKKTLDPANDQVRQRAAGLVCRYSQNLVMGLNGTTIAGTDDTRGVLEEFSRTFGVAATVLLVGGIHGMMVLAHARRDLPENPSAEQVETEARICASALVFMRVLNALLKSAGYDEESVARVLKSVACAECDGSDWNLVELNTSN